MAVLTEEQDAYTVKVRPAEAFEIAPKEQVMHFFLVHCFKPFSGPIHIDLTFSYQKRSHRLTLALPIYLTTFVVPTPLEGAAFVGAWTKYGNELQGVRKTIDGSVPTAAQVAQQLSSIGHLFLVQGVEKTADNLVAAGTFHTATKNAQGAYVTMPCLVRVETKGVALFRVTVHSGHATVSDALMQAVTAVLNAKE
jgi:hypothetical protein